MNPFSPVQTLPDEMKMKVLSYLGERDLCSVKLLSNTENAIAKDEFIWKNLCLNNYPEADRINRKTWMETYQYLARSPAAILNREFKQIRENYQANAVFIKRNLDKAHYFFLQNKVARIGFTIFATYVSCIPASRINSFLLAIATGIVVVAPLWSITGFTQAAIDDYPEMSLKTAKTAAAAVSIPSITLSAAKFVISSTSYLARKVF